MPKVIGTAPYQVPTNADLGSMAYQDSAAVNVELLQVDNVRIDGNTISTTDTNGNLTIAPNGTGDVYLDADTLRVGDSGAAATITTNGAGNLVLNTNSGTNAGSITLNQGANTNIDIAPNGTGLTRIVNAGDAIARIERTGATAAQIDVIARSGFGEVRTSAGNLFLNPASKIVEIGNAADTAELNLTITSTSSGATYPQTTLTNYSASGGWPAVVFRNSKGTSASQVDIGNSATLSSIDSRGWGGTTKNFKLATRIQGVTRDTFATDATVSAALDFIVTSGNVLSTAFRADFDKQMYFYGKVNVDDTTESTSSITGSTIIDGGLGVAKNIYSGGLIQVDNLRLDGNTLSSQDSNGNIVLAPNGTGDVQLDADTVRVGDAGAAATITTNGTGNLLIRTGSTNSGSITINQGDNANIDITPHGTGIVNVGSNVSINGNLTVNGTTTTVNSNTQTVDDPIFTLGGANATVEVTKDRGIEFRWAGATLAITNYISTGTTTITGTVGSTSGFVQGDIITISGATGTEQTKLNGTWTIASVPNSTTFTFVVASALLTGTYTTTLGTTIRSKNGFFGLDQSTGKFTFIPQGNNISETFSGTVGDIDVGGANFANNVVVSTTSSGAALKITQAGTGAALLVEDVASDTTPFTIDASGVVLVGDSTARTYSGGLTPQLQVNGTTDSTASVGILRVGGTAPILHAVSARGTAASPTALSAGDGLLRIRGAGHDGTAYIPSVEILGEVDAATGTNDMPGRLIFSTTADGTATLTERMRIDRNGNIGIGNTDPSSYSSQDFRLAVQRDQNATTRMALINGTSGASAEARFRLIGGTANSSTDFYLADNTAAPFAGITNGSAVNSFRLAFGANERLRVTNAGEVSIGPSGGFTATILSLNKDITGNATALGLYQYGTVKSDVLANAYGVRNNLITEAASFTLPNYYHFFANQTTIGTGSIVSEQYGFASNSNMIGAGNNYGFHSNIPVGATVNISSVARTTNVSTIGTSTVHGFTVGQRVTVNVTGLQTGFNGTFTIASVPTVQSFTYSQTAADVTTIAEVGTVTNVGRWNFFANGTAPNYFNGIIQIANSTASSSTATGALQVSGGAGIVGNLFVGGTTNSAGDVVITSNTSATTTTSGALRVTGGVGVAGNLHVGGIIQIDNLNLDTNTISSTNANGNIVLAPNGTGDVYVDADTLRVGDANAAATITTNGTGNLTLSTNDGTNSGTIVINQGANGNIVLTPNGTGDVYLDADTLRVGDSGAAATITSNGAGALTVTTGGAANLVLNTNSGTTSGSITINNGANGNIVIAPDGTGDVYLDADTLRVGDSNAAATITTNGTGSLTLNTNAGTTSGSIVINSGANGNIVLTPDGTGDVNLDADTVRIGDSNAAATLTTNGTGNLTISTNAGTNSGTIVINQGVNGNVTVTPNGTGAFTVGTSTNTNASKIVSSGTISETVGSTQYLVVSQFDIGTAPNKIPLNQYLGSLAFQNHISGGTF